MNETGWRTFRGLQAELVERYGQTWWASTARFWLWAATAVMPTWVGVLLWAPDIFRFPLRHTGFWILFVIVMIPTGSIATMLFLASTMAETRYQQWIGRRFTWLATAFAATFIVMQVVGIAWPLIVPRHGR